MYTSSIRFAVRRLNMKFRAFRTTVLTAAVTTVLVTAITLFALPKVPAPPLGDPVLRSSARLPEPVSEAEKPSSGRIVLPSDVRDNSVEVGNETSPVYGGTSRRRSTGQSVAIIAGSVGTGAAIGAIAKGGKGAAIAPIAGGVAGLIYDRLTADQQPRQIPTQQRK